MSATTSPRPFHLKATVGMVATVSRVSIQLIEVAGPGRIVDSRACVPQRLISRSEDDYILRLGDSIRFAIRNYVDRDSDSARRTK